MPRKKKRSPRDTALIIAWSSVLVLAAFAAAYGLTSRLREPPLPVSAVPAEGMDISAERGADDASAVSASAVSASASPSEGSELPKARDGRRPRGTRGTLVFVIDDAGHNLWQLEPFLRLPGPVTIAVLPGLPYTRKAAAKVKDAGKELILHQPMEALGSLDPGPGAIRSDMDDETIRRIVRANLAQVAGAAGMNNHMGSRTTADTRVMSAVLDEAKAAGVYYLDSLTTGDSVVHSVASLMRQSTWERSVFLDNTPDKASMLHYIAEGTKIAEKRGYAVMIGHVWSAELAQTLSDLYPTLIEQGFSLSTISRIMMDSYDDDDIGD